MVWLVIGLAVFLGSHSLRLVAPAWRDAKVARWGGQRWRAVFSLVSLAGFALLVWGYGQARMQPVVLWTAPAWLKLVSAALTVPAFVLLAAGSIGRNHIQHRVGHSLVAGTKLWALAHLLAHGWWPGVLLFAAFLVWAVLMFAHLRRRDRAHCVRQAEPEWQRTLLALAGGLAAWFLFAFWLHGWWIGVQPLP